MQNNITSNLQANIEEVRPASGKHNTEYICKGLQSQQEGLLSMVHHDYCPQC